MYYIIENGVANTDHNTNNNDWIQGFKEKFILYSRERELELIAICSLSLLLIVMGIVLYLSMASNAEKDLEVK